MCELRKPPKLRRGDRVAAVSLSSGLAGDAGIRWRYEQGKRRLEELFGLEVVEMPHTLAGMEEVYHHPEARAEDLMAAFADGSIRGIVSCIGGNDSIRMLPYLDLDVIRAHPKIFTGYSDSTVTHFICRKAGLSSFYGPAILTDFAENVRMPSYTVEAVRRTFFSGEVIGPVEPSAEWTAEYLAWEEKNRDTARAFRPNRGYEVLQGRGTARGRLIGGCLEVLSTLRGTELFPQPEEFDRAMLFLETCEVLPPAWFVEDQLRGMGAMGILQRLSGIFWGKPMNETYQDEYAVMIRKVLAEFGCGELPVLYNGSFGHNEPRAILPYGALAEIDCGRASFSILESGTQG